MLAVLAPAESGAGVSQDYAGSNVRAYGPFCRESLPYPWKVAYRLNGLVQIPEEFGA
jgi:hypothetical protein